MKMLTVRIDNELASAIDEAATASGSERSAFLRAALAAAAADKPMADADTAVQRGKKPSATTSLKALAKLDPEELASVPRELLVKVNRLLASAAGSGTVPAPAAKPALPQRVRDRRDVTPVQKHAKK